MIETIVFSLILFILLWPYFVTLGVMDFKGDPNAMEEHLPGRPARRTIGRKNEDMSKGFSYIFIGYLLACVTVYGLLDYKDLVPHMAISVAAWAGISVAIFLFAPANRLMHAYVNLGHIAVIHFVSSLSAFMITSSVLYDYNVSFQHVIGALGMVIGAMFIFWVKPSSEHKKNKKDESEVF